MKKLTTLLILVFTVVLFEYAAAVPANPAARTIKQSNGKELTFVLQGDERIHWAKTSDGYSLLKNANGDYVYAVTDRRGNMIASDVIASNEQFRDSNEKAFLKTLKKDLRFSSAQINAKLSHWNAPLNEPLRATSFPTVGTDSLLVILVDFADLPFTYSNQDFVNMTSQHNYNNYGSVRDYYLDNSDNQFEMALRVVGPYTLPRNMAYYGNYNNENDDYGYQEFVHDALMSADADVDFSHFDNDNDGYVDGIHIIFAGTPESSTGNEDEIWPHRWNLWAYNDVLDGKKIYTYACSAEKRNASQMDGIGTMCHEFGHVLGLPDNYDTDYASSGGNSVSTGTYDIMASGSYNNGGDTPPFLSAGEKIITDWIHIDTLSSPQQNLHIKYLTGKTDTAFFVRAGQSNEFFILEHRKKHSWDNYLPGEGLLIYHGNEDRINNWLNNGRNVINTVPTLRGWFIEPSTGKVDDGVNGKAPWASQTQAEDFGPYSHNVPHTNDGTLLDINITDIHYVNDSIISFNFNAPEQKVLINNVKQENTSADGFTAEGYIQGLTAQNTVSSKGIIFSTDSICAMTGDNVVYDTSFGARIETNLSGLTPAKYFYRAFAVIDGVTEYSQVKSVYTLPVVIDGPFEFLDSDGNESAIFYFDFKQTGRWAVCSMWNGWIDYYSRLWNMTETALMDYFVQISWASPYYDVPSLPFYSDRYWYNLTPGEEYEFAFLFITEQGDSLVYTRYFYPPDFLPKTEVNFVDTLSSGGNNYARYSFAKNNHCNKYFVLKQTDNYVENIASNNGLTYNQTLQYLINTNSPFLYQFTEDTLNYFSFDYDTDYELVVWSIGEGDTVFDKTVFNIAFPRGGFGLASANIGFSDATYNSVSVAVDVNDETSYYLCFYGSLANAEFYNLYTDFDLEQTFSLNDDWLIDTVDISFNIYNMNYSEDYLVWVVPYNLNGEKGVTSKQIFSLESLAQNPCQPTYEYTQISLCQGETYLWNDLTVSQAGTYTDTLYSEDCYEIRSLEVSLLPSYNVEIHDTIGQYDSAAEQTIDTIVYNMTSQSGCDSTLTIYTHTFGQNAGLNVVEKAFEFNIAPNPAEDYVDITFSGLNEKGILTVSDQNGRTVYSVTISSECKFRRINVSNLASGVYYINMNSRVRKLIKE